MQGTHLSGVIKQSGYGINLKRKASSHHYKKIEMWRKVDWFRNLDRWSTGIQGICVDMFRTKKFALENELSGFTG